jgi:hypothetical protein
MGGHENIPPGVMKLGGWQFPELKYGGFSGKQSLNIDETGG